MLLTQKDLVKLSQVGKLPESVHNLAMIFHFLPPLEVSQGMLTLRRSVLEKNKILLGI